MAGGIFSAGYAVVSLTTKPFGWMVSRKFADFVEMRKVLCLEFPGYFVPPLPHKPRIDPRSLQELQLRLSRFLQSLTSTPIFQCSLLLKLFLSDSGTLFESFLKQFHSSPRPTSLSQYWTLTDSISCLSESVAVTPLSNYFILSESLKRSIALEFESVSNSLNSLSGHLQQLTNSVKRLADLQKTVPQAQKQLQIYTDLGEIMEEWAKKEAEISNLTEIYGEILFKCEASEDEEFKLMIQDRESLELAYSKATEQLDSKKARLWSQKDISKWEVPSTYEGDVAALQLSKETAFQYMLPRDTQELVQSKQKIDYLNYQIRMEAERVLEASARKAALAVTEMGRQWDECKQDLTVKWRQAMGRLTELY